jgi:hypothetical protein
MARGGLMAGKFTTNEIWAKFEFSVGSKFAIRTGTFVDSKGFKWGSNISDMRLEKSQIFGL